MADTEAPAADEMLPDANERTDHKRHRVRLSLNPLRWVHLTDGELQDHTVWGNVVEVEEPQQDEAEEKPNKDIGSAPEAPAAGDSAVEAKTGGADATDVAAQADPPKPKAARSAQAG